MGQGLHTKMIQVASRVLGIPASEIYISEMSTDKVPNTSATAASSGSDLNGPAVIVNMNYIRFNRNYCKILTKLKFFLGCLSKNNEKARTIHKV